VVLLVLLMLVLLDGFRLTVRNIASEDEVGCVTAAALPRGLTDAVAAVTATAGDTVEEVF
jgi:hypothetical protein